MLRERDNAANAGYLLGSQAASSTLFTSTKHSSKEKKKKKTTHEKKRFLTQDVNHAANIPGLAAK